MFGSEQESGCSHGADALSKTGTSTQSQRKLPWLSMSGLHLSDRTTSLAVLAGKVFLCIAGMFTVYHVVN